MARTIQKKWLQNYAQMYFCLIWICHGLPSHSLKKNILTSFPAMVTLVWTAHHRDAYHTSMMDAGVAGVLPKTETAEGLISAIRQAISGNSLFTHEQFTRGNHWRQEAGVKWAALTSRERQVLRLLTSEGCDNKCIAKTLGITAKTAAYHVTNILKKLDVKSRNEAIAWAYKYLPDNLE